MLLLKFSLFAFLFLRATLATAEPSCGTRFVERYRQSGQAPAAKALEVLREKGEISLGTQLDFPVFNRFFSMSATCRYIGEHSYIFVEDLQWDTNGGPVVQQDVDMLGELFEHATPADPERGMHDLSVEAFGPAPDVDGDGRIFIVVLDIGDSGIVGFFDRFVTVHANPEFRRDMVYLDATALRLRRYLAKGTLAHEFQHLIHWGHDDDEEIWVDEGLAGYAEEIAGFPEADPVVVPAFLGKPDVDMTNWEDAAYNYGSTYLFVSFLAEKYGPEFIRQLVAESRNGIFGIDTALSSSGFEEDFTAVWNQWIVANFAGNDKVYGYAAVQGRRPHTFRAPSLPFEGIKAAVGDQWGAINIIFRLSGSLSVGFLGEESGTYRVWLYALSAGASRLTELELDEGNQGEQVVVDVDSLVVIVGRTSSEGGLFELSAREIVVPTAVDEVPEFERQSQQVLGAAFPNPFNSYMQIPFELPVATALELSLYNTLGQRLRVLRRGYYQAGHYEVLWDGRDGDGKEVASGTYLVELQSPLGRIVRPMSLLR